MKSQEEEMSKFKLHYRKTKPIDLEEWVNTTIDASQNSPYKISKLQQYNPIYSEFFELTDQNYNSISFNSKYQIHAIDKVVNTVSNEIEEKRIFTKFSPLIDPLRYMVGKLKDSECLDKLIDFELPKYNDQKQNDQKQNDKTSPSIPTDAFFSFLTSTMLNHHNFKNGLDYYGSFLGIQERFKINIEDDLEYLSDSDFFMQNIGKLITLENYEPRSEYANFGSRGNKVKLQVSDETIDIDCLAEELMPILEISEQLENKVPILEISEQLENKVPILEISEKCEDTLQKCEDTLQKCEDTLQKCEDTLQKCEDTLQEHEIIYEKISNNSSKSSNISHSSNNTSNNSIINYSTDEDAPENKDGDDDADWATESNTSASDTSESSSSASSHSSQYQEVNAYIHNFPVQMICLEKCDGTLDELFVNEQINNENGASALFQIVMSLILYQKAFQFTHNDLHTNNIMYMNTDQEYLYYTYNSINYRVPTYGRIFKIIDFGRAIYKYQGKQFCSESFAQGGDAATQYNCEPYFNKNKPRLDPNYSFDLCRLGCSIFDFIIEDDEPYNSMNDLQKTIHRWCLDDCQKNILYKKNGEERYPNFKLYKMIARTVHHHTPQEQLEYSFFKQFTVDLDQIVDQSEYMNIDMIPQYV
jgi:hypothetical protein